jgi:hypothetical protein
MKSEAVDMLKLGRIEANKVLGMDVQEWFRQKYILQRQPIEERIYTTSDAVLPGKIYFGVYDTKPTDKIQYYDNFPIVFHIETYPHKTIDNKLIGVNLNYYDSVKRAIFIDSISTFFERYIEENKKRLLIKDFSQFSFGEINDFLKGYISNIGISTKHKKQAFLWSKFRPTSVLPIDYNDWKWLPLLVPTGVVGLPLSKIQSL